MLKPEMWVFEASRVEQRPKSERNEERRGVNTTLFSVSDYRTSDLCRHSNGTVRIMLKENILRLQVTMDDSLAVNVRHSLGNVSQGPEQDHHIWLLILLVVHQGGDKSICQ